MKKPVDLHDTHYRQVEADVYRAVRAEAFGEDLGQASWITAPECDEFCRWLGLRAGQRMLEVACGSGGTALRIAERLGVCVVGVAVNSAAIEAARGRRTTRALQSRLDYQVADANETLPCLSSAEIEARSLIGFFLFTPTGVNEVCIRQVGLRPVLVADVTASVSATSGRRHEARLTRKEALCERLSRFAFMAEKPETLVNETGRPAPR